MTISPRAAAADAEFAALPPLAARAAVAAGTRSKPVTRCPALTRLAAIGAPILPRPIKPIAAIAFLLNVSPVPTACRSFWRDRTERQEQRTWGAAPRAARPRCTPALSR